MINENLKCLPENLLVKSLLFGDFFLLLFYLTKPFIVSHRISPSIC